MFGYHPILTSTILPVSRGTLEANAVVMPQTSQLLGRRHEQLLHRNSLTASPRMRRPNQCIRLLLHHAVADAGPALGFTGSIKTTFSEHGRNTEIYGNQFFINNTQMQPYYVFKAAAKWSGRMITYSVEFLQNEFWDRTNEKVVR